MVLVTITWWTSNPVDQSKGYLMEDSAGQSLDCWWTQDCMSRAGVDFTSSIVSEGLGGVGNRAGGVDQVVKQYGHFTVDISDQIHHVGHVMRRSKIEETGFADRTCDTKTFFCRLSPRGHR